MNPATAAKIREIAKALDYKPNRAGLVLAAQKKKLKLGMILFSLDNPFFIDVLEGANEKAQELEGYNCTVLIARSLWTRRRSFRPWRSLWRKR